MLGTVGTIGPRHLALTDERLRYLVTGIVTHGNGFLILPLNGAGLPWTPPPIFLNHLSALRGQPLIIRKINTLGFNSQNKKYDDSMETWTPLQRAHPPTPPPATPGSFQRGGHRGGSAAPPSHRPLVPGLQYTSPPPQGPDSRPEGRGPGKPRWPRFTESGQRLGTRGSQRPCPICCPCDLGSAALPTGVSGML